MLERDSSQEPPSEWAGSLTPSAAEAAIARITGATPLERLIALREVVPGKIVFTTSFGIEDQAISHFILANRLKIEVATLDTGRLFPETYETWARTEEKYGVRIRSFHPDPGALSAMIHDAGVNGFYYSKEARLGCCHVRKVEPLNRALAGARGWVTGLRADQSANRASLELVSVDAERGLLKLNPLIDWTRDAALAHAQAHQVPLNWLHGEGFLSIGCAPCTRAIAPGESERAGRWWWEDDGKKECGLHHRRSAPVES